MDNFKIYPTITAQWQALINEAQAQTSTLLDEELESYLVFLLMRFSSDIKLAESIVGLDFLHGLHAKGREQQQQLRDVGDKCLLFSGLFPGRALKRRVDVSYFVEVGQSAYGTLSYNFEQQLARLYAQLAEKFVDLMDVLQSTREVIKQQNSLDLAQAQQLWLDTSSKHALKTLYRFGKFTDEGQFNPNIRH